MKVSLKKKKKTWFSENNSSKNDSDEVLDILSEYELSDYYYLFFRNFHWMDLLIKEKVKKISKWSM